MNLTLRDIDADAHMTVGQARALIESLETVVALVEGTELG
jgi:hypothetical protein